jgi:hypothetical protein
MAVAARPGIGHGCAAVALVEPSAMARAAWRPRALGVRAVRVGRAARRAPAFRSLAPHSTLHNAGGCRLSTGGRCGGGALGGGGGSGGGGGGGSGSGGRYYVQHRSRRRRSSHDLSPLVVYLVAVAVLLACAPLVRVSVPAVARAARVHWEATVALTVPAVFALLRRAWSFGDELDRLLEDVQQCEERMSAEVQRCVELLLRTDAPQREASPGGADSAAAGEAPGRCR